MNQALPNCSIASSQLRRLSRQLIRQLGLLDAACGNLPLSPIQAHSLIELGESQHSIKQLADNLNIDKSNASRAVSQLVDKGFAKSQPNPRDNRSLVVQLSPKGKKLLNKLDQQQNQLFSEIMAQLTQEQILSLEIALGHYNKAIKQSKSQNGFIVREIEVRDNPHIAQVIRQVSDEYGLTADKGYGVADKSLDSLSEEYQADNARYWVIELDNKILGGAGIAPLAGENGVCELQKMYFLPEVRGKGFAKRLALQGLRFASEQGFDSCYLETTANLIEAIRLYESLEFKHLDSPLGNTGHDACEIAMLRSLSND
ncbi:bifunctional helix-turn-helix transcriptional regulator/GNAT family N-acetyltransferase [Shewanella schlegeliana]|uniref:GNAT family N-acetyltransferase n=1 Tax=Shewanella schlegeliana TaxID=190308 RepID=A0ABS1SV85_9GAMM|nr:bifunctional helix-turn-helix transcriptional regulator/GNAT family N-acetyltransferase [Shewanella schlegeliana]MBL4912438.1 GNAT family N-acetyltransferase [Shewanella schlegeliana]MCL1108092.1 bifunctional helix-turn-helix transcriptional regulator/GNAT family N-acetyltransferase [Shewanella schlegeliana]GIU21753.1 MarR family transcriptional regulator [Shewanella schlegeliana]